MARTIFALIALVALAAPASALEFFEAELPPLPQLDELQTTGAAGDADTPDTPNADLPATPAFGITESSADDGDDSTTCSPVVALRLAAWGGIAGEQRRGLEALRMLAPVSTPVPAAASVPELQKAVALAGLEGLPIQLVQESSGLEVLNMVEVAVRAYWTETYVTWTPVEQVFLLDLATGLPLIANEDAWFEMNCDRDRFVYDHVPTLDMTVYQYSSPVEMEDGWVTEIISVDVRLPELADAGLQMGDGATSITNEEVVWAVWRAIDLLDLENILGLLPLDILNILLTQAEAAGPAGELEAEEDSLRPSTGDLGDAPTDGLGSDGGDDSNNPYSLASAMPAVAAHSGLWMLLAVLALLACLAVAYAATGKRDQKK